MLHTYKCHDCVQNLAWLAIKTPIYTKQSSEYQGDIFAKWELITTVYLQAEYMILLTKITNKIRLCFV